MNRAQSNLAWRCWLSGARHSIVVSVAKALDLSLNLLPFASQVLEGDSVSAFKMRTQLSIVQKSRVDMFHAWAMKVGELGDSNKMFRRLLGLSGTVQDGYCFIMVAYRRPLVRG